MTIQRLGFCSIFLVVLVLIHGCECNRESKNSIESSDERCERVVTDFTQVMNSWMPEPGMMEKAIQKGALMVAISSCKEEGLSEEQASCFDGVKDVQDIEALRKCPAIQVKMPTWLVLPPSEEEIQNLLENQ